MAFFARLCCRVVSLPVPLLCFLQFPGRVAAEDGACMVGDSTCASALIELNSSMPGLDSMAARNEVMRKGGFAALAELRKCDVACEGGVTAANAAQPCAIHPEEIVCADPFWCTTTCALWHANMRQTRPFASCEMFIRTEVYAWRAKLCDDRCLLPEVRGERYPNPTGHGFFCKPGTCEPAAQTRHAQDEPGLGIMECPCNWFGADCRTDWVPVRAIRKGYLGDMQSIVIVVDEEKWQILIAGFRPGSVIRVQHVDPNGVPREQPYALLRGSESTGATPGELEILAGPPPKGLFPEVTEVAARVRSLDDGPIAGGNLFVNPAIAGFFNRRYQFLSDAIEATEGVKNLVVVASGVGLSGAMSAVQWAILERARWSTVHLYYGLRNIQDLPYQHMLLEWEVVKDLGITYVVTGDDSTTDLAPAVAKAVKRGQVSRAGVEALHPHEETTAFFGTAGSKVYAQHAVGFDLISGALKTVGVSLKNTAFVICGRVELLRDAESMVRLGCGAEDPCDSLVEEHVFMNI